MAINKKKATKKKTPVKKGRPTKYREEYCALVIEHMEKGYSFETFAVVVSVNVDTLYEWAKVHAAFSDAKKTAFLRNQLFWERLGIAGATGKIPGFNCAAWIFNMKNRHKWVDKQEITTDSHTIQTVKIELPNAKQQQIISLEPVKRIEE